MWTLATLPLAASPALSQGQMNAGAGFGTSGASSGFGTGAGTGTFGGGLGGSSAGSSSSQFGFSSTSVSSTGVQSSLIQPTTLGAAARGAATSAAGVTSGVQQSNEFASYYANPFAAGILGLRTNTYGLPLYTATATTTGATTIGAIRPPSGGGGGSGIILPTQAPPYRIVLDPDFVAPAPDRLQRDVRELVANSPALASTRNIQISIEGPFVVLRGTAATQHDRRLAENIIRLTPGVNAVRNEISVAPPQTARRSP
jgi:hypothetical protein